MNTRTSAFLFLLTALICLAALAGPAAAGSPFQNLNSYASLIQPGSGSAPIVPVPSPVPADIIPSDPLSRRTLTISSMLINIQPYTPENDLSQYTHVNRNPGSSSFSWDDIFRPITPPGGCGG